jgi:glycosyltransferase involved in cell wall biosynthesis
VKTIIFHPLLEVGGGAEKLALEMHRALLELGYESRLITFVIDEERLEKTVELLTPGFKPVLDVYELPLYSELLDTLMLGLTRGRLVRLRRALLIKTLLSHVRRNPGELFIDTASHVPTPVDIAYVHVPLVLPSVNTGLVRKTYNWLVRRVADSLTGDTGLVLVNSSWTRRVFESVYGSRYRVRVLHPPVDVEYFYSNNAKRDKLIVTVSRFSPEKKLESILTVARHLTDYKFYIIGSATRASGKVLAELRRRIERNGLENVEIKTNMPRVELKAVLARAMFYLHPPYPEHFGLSVAEAVAAGAIPIVYKDGGAWTDIVSVIAQDLGYVKIEEVPGIVRRFEDKFELVNQLRTRGHEVASRFKYENFKHGVAEVIKQFNP